VPLVPVTVTVKLPVVDPMHDSVEVPEDVVPVRVMLVGLRVQVNPVEGDKVSDNAIVPVKPLIADTVIVEVPAEPTATLTLVGLAVTVRSGAGDTVYVTVAVWETDPLVPVTVTVKVPVVDPVHDRVEVPDVVVLVNAILVGDRVQVSPVAGETVSDSVTVPVNPLIPATVMVEVPGEPTTIGTVIGLATTVKSGAAPTV